jgi:hypothetical protein
LDLQAPPWAGILGLNGRQTAPDLLVPEDKLDQTEIAQPEASPGPLNSGSRVKSGVVISKAPPKIEVANAAQRNTRTQARAHSDDVCISSLFKQEITYPVRFKFPRDFKFLLGGNAGWYLRGREKPVHNLARERVTFKMLRNIGSVVELDGVRVELASACVNHDFRVRGGFISERCVDDVLPETRFRLQYRNRTAAVSRPAQKVSDLYRI